MPNGYKDKALGITERKNSPLSIRGRNSYYFYTISKIIPNWLKKLPSVLFVCLFLHKYLLLKRGVE